MSTSRPDRPDVRAEPDEAVERALDVFRRDCRAARLAPRIAERVLVAVALGHDESRRVQRPARVYAAAAAALALVGVAGSLAVRRDGGPRLLAESQRSPISDLEERGIARQWAVSMTDLTVGGR